MRVAERFSVWAAVLGVLGFLFLLSAAWGQDQKAVESVAACQERITGACRAAEDAFSSGDVNGGCKTLLEALRSLDPDRSELVDLTTQPLHLLIFGMCSLMDDEALVDLLADSLDPQANPIDDALLLFFNIEYRTVAGGRAVLETEVVEQVQRAQRMARSPHALVRALGLAALSWYAPEGIVGDGTRTAFNSLAELCPEAKATREVLHRLLLVTAGKDPANSQAMRDLVNRTDWNPAVQALIADDPVVAVLKDMAAQPARTATAGAEGGGASADTADGGIPSVLAAAQNHPEAEVKNWFLRLVNANACEETDSAAAFPQAARVQCEAVANSGVSNLKSVSAAGDEVQPLEALRARHVLLRQAFKANDLASAGTHLDVLLSASSAEEPLDSNTYQNALLDAEEYARRLFTSNENSKALAVFEQLARKYPNSYVQKRDQQHIDHIKSVLASPQE